MEATPPSSRPSSRLRSITRLWFGLGDPVSRRAYLATGAALMAVKYGLDAGLVYLSSGHFWHPLAYLSPILTLRTKSVPNAPEWLFLVMAVMTLPFMWIGVSMSVRRAASAG